MMDILKHTRKNCVLYVITEQTESWNVALIPDVE